MRADRLDRGAGQDPPYLVLVADDDPHLRALVRRVLEKRGYEVVEASTGSECLQSVQQVMPDIVLLDVMMPGMDGLATCAALRALPGGEALPVVIISVLDDQRSINRAFEAGATDYMTKPLNTQVLANRLHYMLNSARTEQMISRAKNEWEATFDSVSDLIVLTDMSGRVARCNRATIERLGTTFAAVVGRPIREVILGDAGSSETRGGVLQGELEIPRLDGHFVVSTYPIHVKSSLDGLVYVFRDITERKQLEVRMLASRKLADLGTLAAGVAHEINSPLQVITGVSQSLLDRHASRALDEERLRRGLSTIHRSGWRCAEIVRALRTYAHAAAIDIVATDLNDVVKDTLLLIENQLKSWSNIAVVTDLAVGLPTLHCDRNQVSQLLINLLTNARDAMAQGGKLVVQTGFEADRGRFVLSVSDTGVGIPDTIRDRLFDPFFTTKPPGQGTGLGLSIVAGIVQAHNGEIVIDSAVGRGTTFKILLPATAPEPINVSLAYGAHLTANGVSESLPPG